MDNVVAIGHLKRFVSFLTTNHRENRFTSSIINIKEIVEEMNIEPKFHEKCIIKKNEIVWLE